MLINSPEVTVLIPNYNGGNFIEQSILSALNQTVPCKVLVVDNNSSDKSILIIKNIMKQYKNLDYIVEKKRGISYALNSGINQINTKYVARLDSDDFMDPNRLEIQLLTFKENSKVILVGTSLKLVDEFNLKIGLKNYPKSNRDIRKSISFMNPIAHPSTMIITEILKKEMYREKFDGAEDLDLWLRILNLGEFINIQTPLTNYRVHDGQATRSNNLYRKELKVRIHFFQALLKMNPMFLLLRILDLTLLSIGVNLHRKIFKILKTIWANDFSKLAS